MEHIPQHIVLFLDGNRRWAKNRGLDSLKGHYQGYKNIIDACEWCKKRGVKVLTAFGFSTENWNRSEVEVNYLMKLLEKGLLESLEKFKKDGVKVKIIGQKERLPKSCSVKSGQSFGEKYNSAYAICHNKKLDKRISPPGLTTKSGFGNPVVDK